MSQIVAPVTGDREYAAARDAGSCADPFGPRPSERSGIGGASLVDNGSWGCSACPRNMGRGCFFKPNTATCWASHCVSMREVGSSNHGKAGRDPDQRPQVWRTVHRAHGHGGRHNRGYSVDGGPVAVSRQNGTTDWRHHSFSGYAGTVGQYGLFRRQACHRARQHVVQALSR
jgi:hypothetical protein